MKNKLTLEEIHAFIIGLALGIMFPFRSHQFEPSEQIIGAIEDEWHYYVGGKVVGILSWIPIAKLVQLWFF